MLYSKMRGIERVVIKKSEKKIEEEINEVAGFVRELEGKRECKKCRRRP
jgi:hypothetical protein